MEPLELSFAAEPAAQSAVLADTAKDLLDVLELLEGVPALVSDARGSVLATSPNMQRACAVAADPGGRLDSGPSGLSCPHASCPHHGGFAAAAIPQLSDELQIVHCAGAEAASRAAAVVAPAVRADCEKAQLMDELARGYQELHLLQSLSTALEDDIDHHTSVIKIVACLRELFPVRVVQIWVPDGELGSYHCLMEYDGDTLRKNLETVTFSPEAHERLSGMGTRILREKHDARDPLDLFLLRLAGGIGLPVAIVPLLVKSTLLGVLLLRIPATIGKVSSALLRFLAAAARQIGLVLKVEALIRELRANEGLRKEMEIARRIQSSLLPQRLPQDASFNVFAGCVTARMVGGDYYDVFSDTPGELGLLIADVSGHSVSSGLVAMSFRSSFRQYREQKPEMTQLFESVNRFLHTELHMTGHFLSVVYATYDKERGTFRYINAGHNPPLVVRANGEVVALEESGLILGVMADWHYRSDSIVLEPGDTLVLYTDGVVEAENQRMEAFGMDRLQAAVKKHRHRSARELYYYVLKELYIFQDEAFNKDDITLITLKVRSHAATT